MTTMIEPATELVGPSELRVNGTVTKEPRDEVTREFDAVVLAIGAAAHRGKVCGLTLAERGRRLAVKAGAARVVVVDSPQLAATLPAWAIRGRDVLILRASDQVVHFPLIDAVRGGGARIAVTPEGEYAGAIWVPTADVADVLAALAADSGDAGLAGRWRESKHAIEHVHGEIARHRAVTRAERRAATKMLFELVHKKDQDGFLSKYLFRPVAYPITRLFLPTPITPNGVTFIVALLAIGGCVIVAGASYEAAVIGSMMQHIAGYFDCTDGEIARLRHEGSRFGQWFDTLTDEATTIAYLLGIGIHVYQRHPEYQMYIGWSLPIGVAGSLVSLYVIYYYLIKVARSGNSQDYPVKKGGKLEPLAQLLHRDFIGLVVFVMAIANITEIAYIGLCLGAVVSALVLIPEHIKLRKDLASGAIVPRAWS